MDFLKTLLADKLNAERCYYSAAAVANKAIISYTYNKFEHKLLNLFLIEIRRFPAEHSLASSCIRDFQTD